MGHHYMFTNIKGLPQLFWSFQRLDLVVITHDLVLAGPGDVVTVN